MNLPEVGYVRFKRDVHLWAAEGGGGNIFRYSEVRPYYGSFLGVEGSSYAIGDADWEHLEKLNWKEIEEINRERYEIRIVIIDKEGRIVSEANRLRRFDNLQEAKDFIVEEAKSGGHVLSKFRDV